LSAEQYGAGSVVCPRALNKETKSTKAAVANIPGNRKNFFIEAPEKFEKKLKD
jgi:hypothetical protein